MKQNAIERLSRLADLRASGALSDAEFEAEKAKLLQGSARWPLYVGIGGLAVAVAVAVRAGVWTMQGIEPAKPLSHSAPVSRSSPTPSPSPPVVVTRTPKEELTDAFFAATGHARTFTSVADGDTTTTSPVKIIDLPFGRALLTKTETKDGCHACSGYIGVYYLGSHNGATTIEKSFAEAVSGWAWGAAPEYKLTTRFTTNPAIYSYGGDMHQGYVESGAIITELTPAGPMKSDFIDTGSDNSGAITDDSTVKPCSIDGKIGHIVRDRSFDLVMSGSTSTTVSYARRNGRFVALNKNTASCA